MLKKSYGYFLVPFFILYAVSACQKPDINFGNQYLDNGITQLIRADTFGVDLSTVYLDSFATSAKGVTLVGGYSDTAFGRIDTKTFMEVAPPSTSATAFANAVYDSLYLVLKLNRGNYYGDSSKPVHINVSRVSQLMQPFSTNGVQQTSFYNTQQFPVDPTPLGSTDIMVKPNYTDSILIRLDDALGKELLLKIKSGNFDIQNATNFINYFHGLCISSNSGTSMVLGCKDSLVMKLRYHIPTLYKDTLSVNFGLNNSSHHFTNITADRSNTQLKNLGILTRGKQQEISSNLTSHMVYTQPATGAMVKIRFPSIQNLVAIPNFVKILRATLVFHVVANSWDKYNNYLPSQLRLSTTTYLDFPGTDLTAVSSSGAYATQYGSLFLDYAYGFSTYSYDITSYIQSIATDQLYPYNNSGLLLIPPSPALETQFARAIFGDLKNPIITNRVELDIYYASVNTN